MAASCCTGGLAGQDSLAGARLSDASQAGRATALVGGLLVFSGLVDLAISVDFGFGGGSHVALIVGAANMVDPAADCMVRDGDGPQRAARGFDAGC